MSDLWICHDSVSSWMNPAVWNNYFRAVECLLGDRLWKLDEKDPLRRKADTSSGEDGAYVVQFKGKEDSRWLFAAFQKSKISMQIRHYKAGRDSFGRVRNNSLSIYIPERWLSAESIRCLGELFQLGNEMLGSFYAYADLKDVICGKVPSTGGSLDLSTELLGVFWLTHFGPQYCDFFQRSRLMALPGAEAGPGAGITVQFAGAPQKVGPTVRSEAEAVLGEMCFTGYGRLKMPGQHAIKLEDLLNSPG
ncbi:hypothetical protein [Haloferula sp. BvORR071]|uniref:hypothetical protein n=1 Tax=Haloferula sp. BvORR071 TaxID=1396141 RepID=UPI000552BF43|nr:hypothetical protein [Haloferula sp. BvORR071]